MIIGDPGKNDSGIYESEKRTPFVQTAIYDDPASQLSSVMREANRKEYVRKLIGKMFINITYVTSELPLMRLTCLFHTSQLQEVLFITSY